MKKITFLLLILMAGIFASFKTPEKPKYIYLNAEQLQPLGIELSKKGLFYQNFNPKLREDNRGGYFAFYSIKGTYAKSILSEDGDGIPNKLIMSDHYLKNKEITNHDFYPMLIGNPQNHYTFDRELKDSELVPVAVCMAETEIPNRTDTLIFWFKPTESFQEALPDGIKIEDYLRLPD